MYVCMYVCMYIYIYVCMYVCMYVYIYKERERESFRLDRFLQVTLNPKHETILDPKPEINLNFEQS